MLIKILGVLDLLAAIVLFILSFGVNLPSQIIIFFAVILLAKGAFILTKSVASAFDIAGAIVLILALFFVLPRPVFFIPGILILQKGFLSLIS